MNVYWDSYGIDRGTSGIRVHASSLERELRNIGVPVSIMSLGTGFLDQIPLLSRSKIFTPALNYAQLLSSWRHASEKVIFHGLSNLNLPIVRIRRRPRSLRMVLTIHDLIPLIAGPGAVSRALFIQSRLVLGRAINLADAIIAVSHWTGETIGELFPEARSKVVVIPNGYPEITSSGGERRAKRDDEPLGILTVGRSEPYKRQGLFVETIRVSGGSVVGTIVSPQFDSDFLGANQDLIQAGRLRLLVNPDPAGLAEAYKTTDVYVQTSLFEGFCLPAAEAQATGLPVVFTSGSGIDEVVFPGHGGGLDRTAKAPQWADKIKDVDKTASLKAREFQDWLQIRHTWKDSAESLKKLYTDI